MQAYTHILAHRYHDFSCGHRVVGHESKCKHLHGHNYRVTWHIVPKTNLDKLGRVLDFSVMKTLLCQWVEDQWDHRTLIYISDPWLSQLQRMDEESVVVVPFNPTAENMAKYLLEEIGPKVLANTDAILVRVDLQETRKCGVTAELHFPNVSIRDLLTG